MRRTSPIFLKGREFSIFVGKSVDSPLGNLLFLPSTVSTPECRSLAKLSDGPAGS